MYPLLVLCSGGSHSVLCAAAGSERWLRLRGLQHQGGHTGAPAGRGLHPADHLRSTRLHIGDRQVSLQYYCRGVLQVTMYFQSFFYRGHYESWTYCCVIFSVLLSLSGLKSKSIGSRKYELAKLILLFPVILSTFA